MVLTQIDMNDPENPISKVRQVKITFDAYYNGEDAWNTDGLVEKLRKYMFDNGWSLGGGFDVIESRDKDGKVITKNEMQEYIYKKHGHAGSKCASCPDPIKWKEVERLKMIEFMKIQEIRDDPKRAPTSGYNWATGEYQNRVVSVLETEEERNKRLKPQIKTDNNNGAKTNKVTKRPTSKNAGNGKVV